MSTESISVLVMHEDPVVTAGLSAILREQPGISVAVRARGQSFAATQGVDVVVADYHLGIDFLEAAKLSARLHGAGPRVMVVTKLDREWEVRSAMNAGIHGYLLQSCQLEELVHGVRMLGRGSRYLCESVAERIADSLTREALTCREHEVLTLVAQGCCNKTIANRLGIAVGTVKTHVKAILEKLSATTRTHAAAVAIQRGLIDEGQRTANRKSSGAMAQACPGERSAEPALNGNRLPVYMAGANAQRHQRDALTAAVA
jgi:DNA-binding NarL/FixJ family response regulator